MFAALVARRSPSLLVLLALAVLPAARVGAQAANQPPQQEKLPEKKGFFRRLLDVFK